MPYESYDTRRRHVIHGCNCLKTSEGGENDSFAKPSYRLSTASERETGCYTA